MANESMIKFLRGNVANLPQTATNGALYFTKDEGIYLGMADGSYHRYGDFITVANVAALPTTGAHATCMYYCTAENILARYDATENAWIQINKQPTADEMKVLLGLGSMAYKSEVAEADLNSALAKKINDASNVQHSHTFVESELNKIADGDVAKWNAAEQNAKDYADGLDEAMNARVEALEAIDHSHTFDEAELNKIVEGDVAKWNAVVADHLDSEDETALKNLIKEAKQAGTDANTNIESYKVTNDARVKAVEDDIAEIIDGTDGILAQAKSYSDGKLATARTEISAEIDADVKVVADELAGYKTSNDAALAGVKATAEAAATKVYTDEELAKKVDKVTGKSLIADSEITRLAGMSDGANKVEASANNGSIKIDGVETVVYTHPDKHTSSDISDFATAVAAVKVANATHADAAAKVDAALTVKVGGVDVVFDGSVAQTADIDTELAKKVDNVTYNAYVDANDKALAAEVKARTDADADFETRVSALEDRFGEGEGTVEAQIAAAVKAEKERAESVEATLETKTDAAQKLVDAKAYTDTQVAAEKSAREAVEATLETKADAAQKLVDAKAYADNAVAVEKARAEQAEAGLQTQINTIMNNPDAEGAINSINEFTQYVKDHGTIAEGMRTDINKNKEDIAANAKAIADQATSNAATYETKTDASAKLTEAKGYTDTEVAKEKTRAEGAEADLAAAIETAKTDASNQDAVVLAEAQSYADSKAAAAQSAAEATAASALATARTEITAEIDTDVKALADDVYTKAQTYTQAEVDAAIEEAVSTAMSWGEF